MSDGDEVRALRGSFNEVRCLTFSPDGRQLLSGNEDATAVIWDLTGRQAARGTPADLEAAWQDLAGEDAANAQLAIQAALAPKAISVGSAFARSDAKAEVASVTTRRGPAARRPSTMLRS